MVMVYIVFQNDGSFGLMLVFDSLMWIIVALLQTLLIAAACDGLAREANKIGKICYILLNDVPTIPITDHDTILRQELLSIAEQATVRQPLISAAGFFEVDYGMMGFIVASVTSYIIVTIQFISD
ncbi:hypothetical protein NQ314_002052 [Rhamnusium bicolor]|uniref:Gustatory receptor n=1 Tax=Rhamnusium bicolor TaxID=1586634 RepID=A0AAV8ZTH2_9CUCU|nr:hypothetical protein NQ314_002052 [Rhamnusium bicolor]